MVNVKFETVKVKNSLIKRKARTIKRLILLFSMAKSLEGKKKMCICILNSKSLTDAEGRARPIFHKNQSTISVVLFV